VWQGEEFPYRRSIPDISRRDMIKMVAGSVTLAGLASGCRFLPEKKIVPFVVQPEDTVTGKPRYFASAFSLSGYATGILVTSHEGRPTKIEGNPQHPFSQGSVNHFALAETMNLYDPDRIKNPQFKGDPATWDEFLSALRRVKTDSPAGSIAVLTETVGSPSLGGILARLEQEEGVRWFQYEPINRDNHREGAIQAFGRDVEVVHEYSRARVVLSLDADIFGMGPESVRAGREIMANRRVEERNSMNRLYAVECFPTTFGATADHRIPLKATEILSFALELAKRVGVPGASPSGPLQGVEEKWIAGLAKDLMANRGASVVVAGDHQPAPVHALVHAINGALGNNGATIRLINPVHPKPVNQTADLKALAEGLQRGSITALVILGGNPVYTAPADLKFGELVAKTPFSAHLSLHEDETSHAVQWSLPASHFLEAWGDEVAKDGTVSVVQPLIEPIYDSRSSLEVADSLLGRSRPGLQIVTDYWKANQAQLTTLARAKNVSIPAPAATAPAAAGAPVLVESNFERAWRLALAEGSISVPNRAGSLPLQPVANLAAAIRPQAQGTGLEMVFLPDPTIYDGRYANNMWLQEMPKPITNFTWDNCFYLSTATAAALNLERKVVLGTPELEVSAMGLGRPMALGKVNGAELRAATASQVGQADDTVVLHFGYGRTKGGSWVREADVVMGGGFNAYVLRTSANPTLVVGAELTRTGEFYSMANVQFHNALESDYYDSDRNVIRENSLTAFLSGEALFKPKEHHLPWKDAEKHKDGGAAKEGEEGHSEEKHAHDPVTMYDKSAFKDYEKFNQWAMTVDLNLCTGCGACVIACQSENNIPAVGKREVQRGREMHWIRIDRYYMGNGDTLDSKNPPIRFQPMACVHCENAPCEPVCPVAATVHSHEGLNQMVYNRCVGTRYCSNNCPYKVRKFNFLHYTMKNDQIPVLQMLNNPSVSVRSRGVMEKCTYCVHRINQVRIEAKKEERDIRDGEVVTACQAACPSQAIIFGDMRKPENAVSKSRASRRNYILLEEANTVPRTTFLMRINNPNPEIEG
jgi:molybdopterin-containing oxidoreductase family iron-sulfur binding subunit